MTTKQTLTLLARHRTGLLRFDVAVVANLGLAPLGDLLLDPRAVVLGFLPVATSR